MLDYSGLLVIGRITHYGKDYRLDIDMDLKYGLPQSLKIRFDNAGKVTRVSWLK